jgi:hypothetical protein
MNKFFFLTSLISFHIFASDGVFIKTSYYGVGDWKMRREEAVKYEKCKTFELARKIFLASNNELREVAVFEKGKWREAGANNNPAVSAEVERIFSGASTGENPCEKPEKPSQTGSTATAQ